MTKRTHTIKRSYTSGMTLVELLVVLAIFMVVTSLTIFDYGSFRTSTSLQNLSDDVALSIRKAQSYAIGAYGSNSNFSYGYGVHFSTTPAPVTNYQSGSTKSFTIFTDITGDKMYTYDNTAVCGQPTASNECGELLRVTTADQISNIYLNDDKENNLSPIGLGGAVDITFIRPNPNANFCYRTAVSPSVCDSTTPISHIEIELSNGQTVSRKIRVIKVWTTGQISTQ
jgi:prepilin-type N-terminal cleavage/methylation domain-containing protein